ncbi:multidrug effflux MFS transporter [uncultured Roseibium sp.]|uniref:multidrug effflux MFS transporter n=1 Tax=uncultured Roseibium sp. TaxID=1936171 RepID=UPI0025995F27|nr:multidrug effflux MFS transporter [uncultured Roseibium sp.]
MTSGLFRSAAVLGLLAAVGPLAIDIYLPALPAIEANLNAGIASTQMTLTAFFLTFGLSQMVYGPLSDQIGRKLPLYGGLVLFILGSISCALSPTIEWLTASRLLQGVGAAVVMVIPRAIIRDMYTGYQATRLMALVMLVISVSPMLAPLAGTGIIAIGGWQAIFYFLAGAAVLSLIVTDRALPETLAPEDRVPVNTRSLFAGLKVLLADPLFMGLTLIGGCGMASFFVFIASAPFVYTGHFGLSGVEFSLAFAVNAIGFFASSQIAAQLGQRFGMTRVIVYAVTGFVLIELALLALTLSGYGMLPVVMFFLFCGNACLGLVIPSTMVLALDHHGKIAGLASSLGGTLQMIAGGLMIAAASPFFDGTVTPLVAAITFCAVAAFTLMKLLGIGKETPTKAAGA